MPWTSDAGLVVKTPNNGLLNAVVATANTARDMASGTVVQIFQGGSAGSYVDRVVFQPTGTATASVARVFLNNGSATTTAGNNEFLVEVSLPAQTISEIAALFPPTVLLQMSIPASYRLYAVVGTTVAAGYAVSCPGSGDY